jgi:hypothetical protein
MYIGLYIYIICLLFFFDFNEIWIFSTDLRKILKYQVSCKSVQWDPNCSMRTAGLTEGRTDIRKIIVFFLQFCNFAKVPKTKNYLMLYRKIIVVLRSLQNTQMHPVGAIRNFFNSNTGGRWSKYWALEGQKININSTTKVKVNNFHCYIVQQ